MLLPSSKNIDYFFLRFYLLYLKSDELFYITNDLIEMSFCKKAYGVKFSSLAFYGDLYDIENSSS